MAANTLIKKKQQKDFADEIFRNEAEAYIFCLNFLLSHLDIFGGKFHSL